MNQETFTPDSILDNQSNIEPKRGSVDFILCTHSPENMALIVDAIVASDGDIIALEKHREGSFGMGTTEEKRLLSERMTEFIAVDNPNTQTASDYFGTQDPFYTQLLDRLRGSGKRIALIDMGSDDPNYLENQQAVDQTLHALESYEETFDNNPNQTPEWHNAYKRRYSEYVLAAARQSKDRESVMRQQIVTLAAENPDLKVTAAIGATHVPLTYDMESSFNVSEVAVPPDAQDFTKEETDIILARNKLG